MPKKSKATPEDLDTFYKAVKGTKPLPKDKIRLAPKKANAVQKKITRTEVWHTLSEEAISPVSSEACLSYKQACVSHKLLRKLSKGQYNIDAILDLHGMPTRNARSAVDRFLHQCLSKEVQVALIIHGKGHHSEMPILKNELNYWLRNIEVVLAFCSATPRDGGVGALYVLLKHNAEETSLGK